MNAKNLAVDHCPYWQVIEHLGAEFPGIAVTVFSDDFVKESIGLSNLSSLVISSKESDMCGVFNFKAHHILESLNRVISSIYEVTYKYVG